MSNAGEVLRLGQDALAAARRSTLANQRFRQAWSTADGLSQDEVDAIATMDATLDAELIAGTGTEGNLVTTIVLKPSAASAKLDLPAVLAVHP